MNYKTIINTPEIIKRDTLFIKYLNDEIKHSKEQYKYHNYHCNQGKTEEHKTKKNTYYSIYLELLMVKDEFYKITDNPTRRQTNEKS